MYTRLSFLIARPMYSFLAWNVKKPLKENPYEWTSYFVFLSLRDNHQSKCLAVYKAHLAWIITKFLLDWAMPFSFQPPCGYIGVLLPCVCPSASWTGRQATAGLWTSDGFQEWPDPVWLTHGHNAARQDRLLCLSKQGEQQLLVGLWVLEVLEMLHSMSRVRLITKQPQKYPT